MNILNIFTDYRQFQIFILGIFSGMPLTIIYSTLSAWMKSADVSIAIITSFAVARVFYSLKFIWAPLVDQVNLPVICRIGHRKSWMCFVSAIIAATIFIYSKYDPKESLLPLYILTIILGFSSATLDIVIDAFRIDTIEQDRQSIASANAVFGYLLGGLISGAGALYMAEDYSWEFAFTVISILYIFAIIFILTLKEPQIIRPEFEPLTLNSWKVMVINPFTDFFKRDGAKIILLFVILYKLGEAMFGVVTTPFYIEMGFTNKEIAGVAKIFGLTAMIIGSYVGGYIMYRFGHFRGLFIAGIAQSTTNLSFIWLHHMGHDVNALIIAIAIENVASGMANTVLVGYLSYLCNKQFSATQYALLSSASGLFSHTVVACGGMLVNIMGWDMYFLMTIILGIPGLVLLVYLNKKYNISNNPVVDQVRG